MKPKNYCLRGIGVGLIISIVCISILFLLLMYKLVECNGFISFGPEVRESFLCPVYYHMLYKEWYVYIISLLIYFGIFGFFGKLYGNRK